MPEPQAPAEEFFAKSELFSELGGRLQERFSDGAREIDISRGEALLRQGDPITHIYGVISGRMEAATFTEDGRQLTVDSYGPGEICGESGVVDGVLSHAELRATEDCRLIVLTRTKFLELLYSSPEFSFRIFALIDAKLRSRTEELRDAQLYGLNVRLAKRLLLSAEPNGDGQQESEEIRLHQAELARRIGVNGEAVNRHLKKWEANGWLKTGRGRIWLIDRDAIARVAAPILTDDQAESGSSMPLARFDLITTAPRSQQIPESGRQCFLVIQAEDYSRLLHSNVKQTIEALNERIRIIFELVENVGGQVLSHTGDVVLVGVREATQAIGLATKIQEKIGLGERKVRGPMFRIGIGEGDYLQRQNIIESDAIREATSVAEFAQPGDVWITQAVARQLDSANHDLHMLGEFELRNLPRKIAVYSVSRIAGLSAIRVRLQALLPQRYRSLWAVAAILVLLSVTFWTGQKVYDPDGSGPNVPANSLAIIPFTYEEGDDAAPFIADGIGHELGYRLSAVPELIVAGLSSSHYLTDNRDDYKALRRAFHVAYVLTGHLASRENGLILALELRDTANNNLAWVRDITLDLSEQQQIQDSVVSDILGFLQIVGPEDESFRDFGGTSNPDAYRAYLNANFLSRTDRPAARDLYLKALALDPEFAAPYAGLVTLGFIRRNSRAFAESLPGTLLEMSIKAVELAPDSARSYLALAQAQYVDQEYSAAKIAIERALALNGRDSLVLQHASVILIFTEDYAGYFDLVSRAWDLNPVDLAVGLRYAWSLEERNEIEAAKRVLEGLERLYPDNHALENLAMTLAWQSGEYRRSYSILQRATNGSDPHAGLRQIFEMMVGYADPAAIPDNTASTNIIRLRSFQSRLDEVLSFHEQDFALTNSMRTGLSVAALLALTGRFQESRDFFEALQQQHKNVDTRAFFAAATGMSNVSRVAVVQLWVLTKLGRTVDARRLERRLLERIHWSFESGARDRTLYLAEAQIHAIMGRNTEAMLSLRNALDGRFIRSVYLRRNPLLENLHTEPEFWSLIAEVETTLAKIRQDIEALRAGLAE